MKKIIIARLLVLCCVALFGCTVIETDRMFSDVEISVIAQTHYELKLSERKQKELFDIFEKLEWKDYTEDDLPLGQENIFIVANALVRLENPEGAVVRARKTISFDINFEARFVALKFLTQEQKIPESAANGAVALSEDFATTRTAKLSKADLEKITAIFDGATRQERRPFLGIEITHNSNEVQPPQQQKKQLEDILVNLQWQRHDGQSHISQIEDTVGVFADVDIVYWGKQGWTVTRDQWVFRIDFSTGYAICDCVYISSLSSRHFAKLSDADLATVKAIFGYVEPVVESHRLTIIDTGNFIFDKPYRQSFAKGKEIVLHSHVICDVDLGMYVDGKLVSVGTSIQTEDGFIWEYRFVMPDHDVTLEFKIAPSNPYINLTDVFPEAANFGAENVDSVRFEKGYVGVAPGSLIDIEYVTKAEDIVGALQALDAQLVEVDSLFAQVCGGWYNKITFCSARGSFDLTISNGYVQKNGKYYRFIGSYEQPQYGRKCHSFLTYSDKYTVRKDGVVLGEFQGLSQFEFSEYVDQVVLPETGITFQTEFGTILLLSDTRFVFDGKDYVLTKGSFDFAFDLAEEKLKGI